MRAAAPAVLLLALALAGCTASPPAWPVASEAPVAWSFVDTEGQRHSNATAAGEPAVLFFLATWCTSCRAMTQRLAAVHAEVREDVGFYSVSIEANDDHAALEQWKQQYRQPWPHGRDEGYAMARAFGIVAQSSVVVLDAEGRVVQQWGYPGASEAEVRAAVQRARAA